MGETMSIDNICVGVARNTVETLSYLGNEFEIPTLCVLIEMMAERYDMGVLEFYDMLETCAREVVANLGDVSERGR